MQEKYQWEATRLFPGSSRPWIYGTSHHDIASIRRLHAFLFFPTTFLYFCTTRCSANRICVQDLPWRVGIRIPRLPRSNVSSLPYFQLHVAVVNLEPYVVQMGSQGYFKLADHAKNCGVWSAVCKLEDASEDGIWSWCLLTYYTARLKLNLGNLGITTVLLNPQPRRHLYILVDCHLQTLNLPTPLVICREVLPTSSLKLYEMTMTPFERNLPTDRPTEAWKKDATSRMASYCFAQQGQIRAEIDRYRRAWTRWADGGLYLLEQ